MTDTPPDGDRIAKVLSRAGTASRRDAERMIAEGRVSVNGKTITSPALNVTARDRIVVDGKPVGQPEAARLWLYHKPAGLVTSARDEKDRETVFDAMPDDMPRVMSVGRLDINSEGLLLLTNDGGIKRRLELPSTGWLRRYRVRINGSVSEARLDELRRGITVDGIAYQPMMVTFDRQQGANAWLTISIREGKNREIRRAMEAVNTTVNRLIRVSYGPFQLGNLAPGAVEEVKGRVLREQLGMETPEAPTNQKARPRKPLSRSDTGKSGPRSDTAKSAPRSDIAKSGPRSDTGKSVSRSDCAKAAPRGDGARSGPRSEAAKAPFRAAAAGKPADRAAAPRGGKPAGAGSNADKPGGKTFATKSFGTKPAGSKPAGAKFGAKPAGARSGTAKTGTDTASAGRSFGAKPASKTGARRDGPASPRPPSTRKPSR
ncbi:pseudouridine synthase [Loktanella fryxellensis]|nr:pseudouridine synthase [Loktanella fryxellensis]